MPFAKGNKLGGRIKGTKNRVLGDAETLVVKLNVDPLEVLLLFSKGDWKSLGYPTESTVCYTNAGIEYERFTITPEIRMNAAKEAVKYCYSQKKAIEIAPANEKGFKIEIVDYTKEIK
jgi:hypothetical protein